MRAAPFDATTTPALESSLMPLHSVPEMRDPFRLPYNGVLELLHQLPSATHKKEWFGV